MEPRIYGEILCEKTASGWSAVQFKDETARVAVGFILSTVPIDNTSEEAMPDTL